MQVSGDTCRRSVKVFSPKVERNYQRQVGGISDRGGIQTRIRKYSSSIRDTTHVCVLKKQQYFTCGGKRIVTKRCYRNCTRSRQSKRFLQHIFPGPQEVRGNETGNKLTSSEQVSAETTFQDGHFGKSTESSETGRLGIFSRLEGCVPTHSNSQKSQKVPALSNRQKRQNISVHGSLFWPDKCTAGVHKSVCSRGSLFEKTKCSVVGLPGRLVISKSKTTTEHCRSRKNAESPCRPRFHCKRNKVVISSQSNNNIHRRVVSFATGDSDSDSRQRGEIVPSSGDNSLENTSCNSKGLSTSAGYNCIMHRPSTQCQIVHETHSVTSATPLETSITRAGSGNPIYSQSKQQFSLVETVSSHYEGSTTVSSTKHVHDNVGCFEVRFRGSHEQSGDAGCLVANRTKSAHKLSGDGSSISNVETFLLSTKRSNSVDTVRQLDGRTLHQQTRGDPFSTSLQTSMQSLELGTRSENVSESSSYCGQSQCASRSVEPHKGETNRMVTKQCSSIETVHEMGGASNGSVRLHRQSENDNILHMVPSSTSICSRCSDNLMGEHVCICVSSDMPSTESSATHVQLQSLPVDPDSPMLAQETLVSQHSAVSDSMPNKATSKRKSVTSTKNRNIASQSRKTATDCMATIDGHFKTKGFSTETRKLLSASWRKGTQKDYTSKFRKFNSWCSTKQVDPYTASLNEVADFLTSLYTGGLQYRTIAGYRSMLSAVLPPVGNFPVGQHPHIIRLLKGVFNSRPPKVRLLPEWDLPLVLELLQGKPFEPLRKASLKYVTWKTVFLVAITSFRRCSDIQSLQLGEGAINVQSKGVTFIRQGLSKQDRPTHFGMKLFVPAFPENKLLDPKRSLAIYVKQTEQFRRSGGKDEKNLFLAINSPHQPVTAQTISSWIVNVVRMAYKDPKKKIKGHSTRAVGPSWALFRGASVKSILDSADWSRESTFAKFYLRQLDVDVLK